MKRLRTLLLVLAAVAALWALSPAGARPSAQTSPAAQNPSSEVPANAPAEIQQVAPDRAAAGSQVTVKISGANFSAGAYVSFSTPDVHVLSTERTSATEMQATVTVRPGATAQTTTLYVSNPAGAVAHTSFQIMSASGQVPPAPAAPPAAPSAPTPAAPAGTPPTSPAPGPQVASVTPAQAAAGSQATLKIQGKNFASGAQVSFSNPGIQVTETKVASSAELTVNIQIAADAAPGATGLFVVNPDNSEVESSFTVSGASAPAATTPAAAATTSTPPPAAEQKFEVYNLGDAATIFKNPTRSKGTLVLAGHKLSYQEAGKTLFSAAAAEIQEIGDNIIFGLNTGTFHVILKSSKTYNFVSTSLRPADTQKIVDALRRALQ